MSPHTLRDTLHDIVPEPPDDLGLPHTARGRAKVVRRRRYYGAASGVALTVMAVFGVTVVGNGTTPRPVDVARGGDVLGGTFPDWKPRGDLLHTDAVPKAESAWIRGVAKQGVNRTETSVLYAGGGSEPVVVLHALGERGGERLVVVTAKDGEYEVYADVPAPMLGSMPITVLLGAPARSLRHPEGTPCESTPGYAGGTRQRLLVLGEDVTSVKWFLTGVVPAHCASSNGRETLPAHLAVVDGAAFGEVRIGRYGDIVTDGVNADGSSWTADGVTIRGRTVPDRYNDLDVKASTPPTGLDWPLRTDESRAEAFAEAVRVRNSISEEYGECRAHVMLSLPDGTPVVLCVTVGDHRDPQVVIWAENGERKARSYARIGLNKPGSPYSAIVQGHRGRWLVVIGPPDQKRLMFVDGEWRREVPIKNGVGWLPIETEPEKSAYLTGPDYGPDGGFSVSDRVGKDREPRDLS